MVVKNLRYSESHEWLKEDGNDAYIGITDYAQDTLGDIVFADLPEVGDTFNQDEAFGALESVKAASDIYLPVSGKIIDVNTRLIDEPELLNDDPFGSWIVKIEITNPKELDALLTSDAYEKHIQ